MKVLPEPVARLRRARFSPRASFSSDGADGGVLVVAPARLAALVRRDERLGELAVEVEADGVPRSAHAASSGVGNSAIGRGRRS